MKWTIALLVGLGILASICVVMLVNAFRADSSMRSSRGDVPVVLAATDLPAWTVLSADDIEISHISKSEAPGDCFNNTALVVGKVLSIDMVKGQLLTKSKILAQGGPQDIAALLAPGMRAVSVTVSGDQVSGGLLYPRCFVDVLASFQLRGNRNNESKGEALSTTLLERIKVLAIAGESMLTTPDKEGKETSRATSKRLTVTLELDSKQAEALQLAINNGRISLTLRNPLDTEPVSSEATILNSGKLSRLGELLGTTVKTNPAAPSAAGSSDSQPAPSNASSEQESSSWDITVIRGNKITDEQVNETTP